MKKLLMLAMLATSLSVMSGYSVAQETGSGEEGGADASSGATSGSSSSDGSSSDVSNTTNAPNAPFLGNRDRIGSFFSDEDMTTMLTGDDFTSAYNAMSDEDRAQVTEECASDNGQNRAFCDAFTAAGSN
ncbi:MAG TPA: hypothetical protein VGN97_20680 [Mesorhizobium sp.]|jgi:hypothetical protein|nr:hypothetical protein [Mesorhizobium sp.]